MHSLCAGYSLHTFTSGNVLVPGVLRRGACTTAGEGDRAMDERYAEHAMDTDGEGSHPPASEEAFLSPVPAAVDRAWIQRGWDSQGPYRD